MQSDRFVNLKYLQATVIPMNFPGPAHQPLPTARTTANYDYTVKRFTLVKRAVLTGFVTCQRYTRTPGITRRFTSVEVTCRMVKERLADAFISAVV